MEPSYGNSLHDQSQASLRRFDGRIAHRHGHDGWHFIAARLLHYLRETGRPDRLSSRRRYGNCRWRDGNSRRWRMAQFRPGTTRISHPRYRRDQSSPGTISFDRRRRQSASGMATHCQKIWRPSCFSRDENKMNARSAQRNHGYLLVECLVYIGVLFVLLGVSYIALFRCINNSVALRRNAEDISKALHIGERWRADVRSATGNIRFEETNFVQLLYLPNLRGQTVYCFATNTISRS